MFGVKSIVFRLSKMNVNAARHTPLALHGVGGYKGKKL